MDTEEHPYIVGEPIHFTDLLTFLIHPGDFFLSDKAIAPRWLRYLILWILGMVMLIARRRTGSLPSPFSVPLEGTLGDLISRSWWFYWLYVMLVGMLSGAICWYVGGWWYNMKLSFCSPDPLCHFEGRVLYIYNKLIYGLPILILGIFTAFAYESPNAMLFEFHWIDELSWIPFALFTPYATINSYRSVVGTYELSRLWSAVWFLILPFMFYLLGMVGLLLVMLRPV